MEGARPNGFTMDHGVFTFTKALEQWCQKGIKNLVEELWLLQTAP